MTNLEETARMTQEARRRIAATVYGHDEAVTLMLVALAADGHVMLEGIPGVGKTTLAKSFAHITGLDFKRVQLTPDLMPTDITGHMYFDQKRNEFGLRKGPVFTNVLLADELNRTPPRTQAALLEVMQEHQVTIEGRTHALPDPFLVVATKNPIEVEGVYPLPEAELDRFMVHATMSYPSREVEAMLLDGKLRGEETPAAMPGLALRLREAAGRVFVHPDLRRYLLDIVRATREHDSIELGGSPRATAHLVAAARAHAAISGRDYAIPDDVKAMAVPVLGHRILRTSEAEVQGVAANDIIADLVEQVEVPIRR